MGHENFLGNNVGHEIKLAIIVGVPIFYNCLERYDGRDNCSGMNCV